MRWIAVSILAATLAGSASLVHSPASAASQAADTAGAKTWIGRAREIEDYLRTAPIVRREDTDRGVTRPVRAFFPPGGAIESMTWKVPPSRTITSRCSHIPCIAACATIAGVSTG